MIQRFTDEHFDDLFTKAWEKRKQALARNQRMFPLARCQYVVSRDNEMPLKDKFDWGSPVTIDLDGTVRLFGIPVTFEQGLSVTVIRLEEADDA